MGLFCVNFHVREKRTEDVIAALHRLGASEVFVRPKKSGWVSFYEAMASDQDEERIQLLAQGVSRELSASTIAFLIHDSDIGCYWMYERGQLIDQYNSNPDYFEEQETALGPNGGRPDILIKYCRPDVTVDELVDLLSEEQVFAEQMIEQLAYSLGIDPDRALTDYRDVSNGDGSNDIGGPSGFDHGDSEGDELEEPSSDPQLMMFNSGLGGSIQKLSGVLGQLSGFFGGRSEAPADPKAVALVGAAVDENLREIDRLLAEGVAVDSAGPAPAPEPEKAAGLANMLLGGLPAVTPLLAATLHKRRLAVEHLLDKGANPNLSHTLFGTPLHVACSTGDADMVRLLLNQGADANCRNNYGQTPRETIADSRRTWKKLADVQGMARSLGVRLPANFGSQTDVASLEQGWRACEHLLDTLK